MSKQVRFDPDILAACSLATLDGFIIELKKKKVRTSMFKILAYGETTEIKMRTLSLSQNPYKNAIQGHRRCGG